MVVSILTAASPVMLAQEVIKIAASQRSQMGLPASANPTVGNGNRATEWRSPACHPTPAMAAPAPKTYERAWLYDAVSWSVWRGLVRFVCKWTMHVSWGSRVYAHFSCEG